MKENNEKLVGMKPSAKEIVDNHYRMQSAFETFFLKVKTAMTDTQFRGISQEMDKLIANFQSMSSTLSRLLPKLPLDPQKSESLNKSADSSRSIENTEGFSRGSNASFKENDLLREKLLKYKERLKKVQFFTESLILELETQKKTIEDLTNLLHRLKKAKSHSKIPYKNLTTADEFSPISPAVSWKAQTPQDPSRNLETLIADYNSLKSAHKSLKSDLKLQSSELQNYKSLYSSLKSNTEQLPELLSKVSSLQASLSSLRSSTSQALSSYSSSISSELNLLLQKTLTASRSSKSKPSQLESCVNLLRSSILNAQTPDKSLKSITQHYLKTQKILAEIAVEVEEEDFEKIREKIEDLKGDRNYLYAESQRVLDILNELAECTGKQPGQLLGYLQEVRKAASEMCVKVSEQALGMFRKTCEQAEAKIQLINKRIHRIEEVLYKD